MVKPLLVTGSAGLIGSAVCSHFASLGYAIHGVLATANIKETGSGHHLRHTCVRSCWRAAEQPLHPTDARNM
ncbi:MAG: NAD-dependent epimerase/dehydratase family protein [Opitutaceae bacterium]|nr:NAD-dependent epimerase/dehydratase family protein [Opitutaceae bacterium]